MKDKASLKILIVTASYFHSNYGGGQVYVKNIVNEMIAQNLDVSIATPGTDAKVVSYYQEKPVYTFTDKMLEDGLMGVKKLITKINPSIVHVHGFKEPFSLACKSLKIPCIVTAHHGGLICPAGALLNSKDKICNVKASDSNCLPCVLRNVKGGTFTFSIQKIIPFKLRLSIGKWLKKIPFIYFITPIGTTTLSIENKKREWKKIYTNASLLIAPSIAIKDAMLRNGASKNKIKVIPHGIPINIKDNSAILEENIEASKKNKRVKFFYVGRICKEKGVHIMLEAFSDLKVPAEIHIIGGTGNSKEEKYYRFLKKKYKNHDNIFWYGKVPPEKVNEKIKMFDIMIHPAFFLEVFGLTIAESLSMGKPVIATKCGGAEMQIKHKENGLLIPPNDVNALKEKMKEILECPDLLIKLKKNTGVNVNSINNHVKDLVKIYKPLVKR
ncbi:glycosyltransferase family 4 protein [Polaribacter sp. L3A8]|uniref:glycosyltransferase family 4 protein n=1 Tax=Polaribacter sp. L3A8 TaxID=2686361 RepID=UPI00131D9AFE|nr:glycosyltransferase family 4 protein [Polaribacter sp. L3A8]